VVKIPQSKQKHAEYMRNYREKKRQEESKRQESIAKQNKQIEEFKQLLKENRKKFTILDDVGREPQERQEPQFPRVRARNTGCCLWDSITEPDNEPKPKSNQQRLKTEFENHAE
jgi:hypothetical protein